MPQRRILFVNRENTAHSKLTDLLINSTEEWVSNSAADCEQALAILAEDGPFDVVISEMEGPGIDGIDMLKTIRELYPGTTRYIVSDSDNREAITRAMAYAHQCVPRSIPVDKFAKLIDNSLGIRKILSDKNLLDRISAIDSLPSPPEIYKKLVGEFQSENVTIQKISDIIKQDVGITAKLLQIVNSAYFGLQTHVESPMHAVNLLGLDTVKSVVMAAGTFNQLKADNLPGFSCEAIYDRSMAVGAGARLTATAFGLDRRESDSALMAGMLHDVGKLVMLGYFPDELMEAAKISQEKKITLHAAEKEVLGVSDAQMGAYLLSLWGLPDSILEAVALHYDPNQTPSPIINTLTTVHLAYALDYDQINNVRDDKLSAVDLEYLDQLNLKDQLEDLRNFCTAAV
ncbi:MAG: HDOD domain-containing protein [FCB group bacterium]|nr:HDOD domain-containing protein [FCB group bacterium]